MDRLRHRWDLPPRAAVALQHRLRARVIRRGGPRRVRYVAGTDVGFERGGTIARAAVAVLALPELELVDYAVARVPVRFPYVPGLLSFREVPPLLAALARLRVRPELILCDGHGVAHPRGCGLASHLGLATGIPTVGVAKTRLVGRCAQPPPERGSWTPLTEGRRTIGAVLRTRAGVKPIYVSVGHRIGLQNAIRHVMACVTRYRLPETTRWAHRLASGETPPRVPRR